MPTEDTTQMGGALPAPTPSLMPHRDALMHLSMDEIETLAQARESLIAATIATAETFVGDDRSLSGLAHTFRVLHSKMFDRYPDSFFDKDLIDFSASVLLPDGTEGVARYAYVYRGRKLTRVIMGMGFQTCLDFSEGSVENVLLKLPFHGDKNGFNIVNQYLKSEKTESFFSKLPPETLREIEISLDEFPSIRIKQLSQGPRRSLPVDVEKTFTFSPKFNGFIFGDERLETDEVQSLLEAILHTTTANLPQR